MSVDRIANSRGTDLSILSLNSCWILFLAYFWVLALEIVQLYLEILCIYFNNLEKSFHHSDFVVTSLKVKKYKKG